MNGYILYFEVHPNVYIYGLFRSVYIPGRAFIFRVNFVNGYITTLIKSGQNDRSHLGLLPIESIMWDTNDTNNFIWIAVFDLEIL